MLKDILCEEKKLKCSLPLLHKIINKPDWDLESWAQNNRANDSQDAKVVAISLWPKMIYGLMDRFVVFATDWLRWVERRVVCDAMVILILIVPGWKRDSQSGWDFIKTHPKKKKTLVYFKLNIFNIWYWYSKHNLPQIFQSRHKNLKLNMRWRHISRTNCNPLHWHMVAGIDNRFYLSNWTLSDTI